MTTYFLRNLKAKCTDGSLRNLINIQKRCMSHEEVVKRRNEIFDHEAKRQKDAIGRIEKIEVRYMGLPNNETLIMNRNLSTPYNVAQHFSENIMNNSVLALINANVNWDMHRPLKDSCTLQLLNFRMNEPYYVNNAFWRSCSFILGAVLHRVFKDEAGLILHSFPYPNIRSGSYIHDFSLSAKSFKPTEQELKTIAVEMMKFATENHRFERLDVDHNIALELFKDNPFKREQLPSISNKNNGIVPLYRVGEHIDISKGPMIASTKFLQRVKICAVHKVSRADDPCHLYRIQGIALPSGFKMSYYAFNVLGERAKKLNDARLPHEQHEIEHDPPMLQKKAN